MAGSTRLARVIVISAVVIFAVCLIVGGYVIFSPNARVYIRGPVLADAKLDPLRRAEYTWLQIGSDKVPYDGGFAFDVQLADGHVLTFPEIDVDLVRTLAYDTSNPNEYSMDWPLGATRYYLPGVNIIMVDDSAISIRLRVPSKAMIRTSRVRQWYSLPLTEREVIELFGRPERIGNELRL